MNVTITKSTKALNGTFTVPGDKSISHRSIMLGAIALGTTEISNFLKGADCLATIECFRNMGIKIEEKSKYILVHGRGLHGLKQPSHALDVGNSGTTTRLLSGILAGQDFPSTLTGDLSLNKRPMDRIIQPLTAMGGNVNSLSGDGCAPLHILPGRLHGHLHTSVVASAQVKSAILLAGLYADSETAVTEPLLSRNHTELMLLNFGATVSTTIHTDGRATAHLSPCDELHARQINVPGDISSAAYLIAAGLLIPGSELLIRNVGINFTRSGFLTVCKSMGGDITLLNTTYEGGEGKADILVKASTLQGTMIKGDLIPTLIDEIPIIAIMAACAEGTTTIRDAAELKVKETNRIDTVSKSLQQMGATVIPTKDGMIIEGGPTLHGAVIDSCLDHRIAMAFAIAGLCAKGETTIMKSQCVDVSYPSFWQIGLFN